MKIERHIFRLSMRRLLAWRGSWLAARAKIHLTPARIGKIDCGATEMAGLARAPVAVEAMLLAPGQALLFEVCDQFWRIDDAATAVGSLSKTKNLA